MPKFHTRRIAALSLCVLLIGGCGESAPPAQDEPAVDNVFQNQVDALDKAKGVQDTLDQALKERTEQLEDDED